MEQRFERYSIRIDVPSLFSVNRFFFSWMRWINHGEHSVHLESMSVGSKLRCRIIIATQCSIFFTWLEELSPHLAIVSTSFAENEKQKYCIKIKQTNERRKHFNANEICVATSDLMCTFYVKWNYIESPSFTIRNWFFQWGHEMF